MHLRSLLVAGASLGLLGLGVAPAHAIGPACLSVGEDPGAGAGIASAPLDQLGLAQAQRYVRDFAPPQQEPVRVAVLDSGVRSGDGGPIPVRTHAGPMPKATPVSYFLGTEVAGLIAGADDGSRPVGFAPGTEIVDVRVYVEPDAEDPDLGPTGDNLADGLEWVASHAGDLNIQVATVPFAVGRSPRLESQVKAVQAQGVVVVAATGDRPEVGADGSQPTAAELRADDAARSSYPAGYPGVVAVNSTGDGNPDGLMAAVRKNSRTTVAVPTFNAVSYGLNGVSCVVQPIATGAAAAEVSGVVALLWQMYPRDSRQQIVARLVNTANGTTDDPTPLTGAGVVQPYAALTRPLDPDRRGRIEQTVTAQDVRPDATAPTPAPDLLAKTRDDAVWWGLIGGGLLVVALLLRPVLSRRRP